MAIYNGTTKVAGGTTVENVLTSTSTTNALSANQGKVLNDNKQNKLLVSDTTITSGTGFTVSGLDINTHGGVYDILFEYYFSAGVPTQPSMQINAITTAYYEEAISLLGIRTASGALTPTGYYYHNVANFIVGRCDNSYTPSSCNITLSNGLHIIMQSISSSVASAGQSIATWCGRISQDTPPNITSLTFTGNGGTFGYARVRIYRR